ncbi:MAG: hypothetical protein AB1523_07985 [Bacillota bacterium]
MEITQKFKQLPPLAGVPFTGFEFAEIESRKLVVKQLRDYIKYCLKEARSPAVQVILGEWGEGKTEAHERYIKTAVRAPNSAYRISASTIAQSLPKVKAENPLASVNFLAAVFYAIKHEERVGLIPSFERFMNVERWLEETLKAHAKGKILVFIDEFEELILEPSALKGIISGLKELINKQYPPVAEKGQYPGIISFLLSCTPDAYARMQRDPEIVEVFGSWERRAGRIQLAPVTKQEGVKFLCDLMYYAFGGRLPEPLPIRDLGVFYTLQATGRGNLGALVTLFVKVFNSAANDDQTMHIIDGVRVLEILADETISVYGGTARCVERRLLDGFEELLDKQEAVLLRLLAGELRPFSLPELAARLAIPDITEVSALVARINQKLASTGVANAIVRYVPLREGCSFKDVQKALHPEIRGDEIQVDGFVQHLNELEDDLTYLELREGQLVPRIFFPWDHRMISAAFEGISPDSARRLEKRVERIIDQSEFYYRLSNELILQLFPTPIPVGLEFIKDRDLRLKTWRDTTARFPQLFRDDVVRAFLSLVEYVEAFNIKADILQTVREGLSATVIDTSQNATIKCYCHAHYGDLGREVVQRIEAGLRELSGAHLSIVIHVGEVTDQGREEVRTREMEDQLLFVPLHTTLAKRLLIAYRCKTRYPEQLDKKLFVDSMTRMFKTEIELSNRIKEWLDQGVKAGIVLRDLFRANVRSERELADSLKFYINRLGEPGTPENIFRANKDLMDFIPFGSRAGFVPDIESATQLDRYTEDLVENGFIRLDPDRTVHVITTPPEKRLLYILEKARTIAKSEVGVYFINCARARNILEDVYLNILKNKGVVLESKGLLSLARREEALEEAKSIRKAYMELLVPYKQQKEWPAFSHVFVTKQRDYRFIAISKLEAYLERLYEDIQKAAQRGQVEVFMQRTALLKDFADHLRNSLMPRVQSAISEARRMTQDISRQVDSLLKEIEHVVSYYNKWLKQNASLENVEEARELKKGIDRLERVCTAPIKAEDLSEEEKQDNAFDHRNWTSQDRYFNITLRRLQKSVESLHQQAEQYRKVLRDMSEAQKALQELGQETRSRLLTINVTEECRLSRVIRTRLEAFLGDISQDYQAIILHPTDIPPALNLRKMLEDLQELYRPLKVRYQEAERAITELQELVEVEARFYNTEKRCLDVLLVLTERTDLEPFQSEVQALEQTRVQILEDYKYQISELETSFVTVQHAVINQLKKTIEKLDQHLEDVRMRAGEIWKRYARECMHFVDSIFELLKLAKKQDASLNTDAIQARCEEMLTVVEGQEWPDMPLSHYEIEKAGIREATIELLKKSLDEAEGNVLMALVTRRDESKSGWFDLPEIVKKIAEETSFSFTEVERLLRSLVQKGYLVEGIAIPV